MRAFLKSIRRKATKILPPHALHMIEHYGHFCYFGALFTGHTLLPATLSKVYVYIGGGIWAVMLVAILIGEDDHEDQE